MVYVAGNVCVCVCICVRFEKVGLRIRICVLSIEASKQASQLDGTFKYVLVIIDFGQILNKMGLKAGPLFLHSNTLIQKGKPSNVFMNLYRPRFSW